MPIRTKLIIIRQMTKNSPKISFCIPIYNEGKYLLDGLKKITKELDNVVGKNNYEIIIIDNGSTDNSSQILENIGISNIRFYKVSKKGIGLAYRKAISKSKHEHVILSAIDLPFGFSDLKNALKVWDKHDIIFGSKAHPDSIIYVSAQRKIASNVYRTLLQLLFKTKIKDTQGTIFLKKSKIAPILKHCNSNNAFFTTQLAIHGKLYGLKMKEVSVKMEKQNKRASKFNVLNDGAQMFLSMIKKFLILKAK